MLSPIVIFKGERFKYDWVKGDMLDTVYGM